MSQSPLVTIMITTKNRHHDLRVTLEDLRRQDYPNIEMLLIDDASTEPIVELVHTYWPMAKVIRYEASKGQAARRNEGFQLASGEFVMQLDDDCSPVAPYAITRCVEGMESMPRCAAISFYTWNGMELPPGLEKNDMKAAYVLSYIGAAAFIRKAAVAETRGYQEGFFGYAEEEELGLQFLEQSWGLIFRPDLVVHHRLSMVNRATEQTWKRAFRNRLWTIFIHMPLGRMPVEIGWKLVGEFWESIRLARVKLYFQAISEAIKGRDIALRARRPLHELALRRYDGFRTFGSLSPEQFADPPKRGVFTLKHWMSRRGKRIRQASRWSKAKAVGRGDLPTHQHELND